MTYSPGARLQLLAVALAVGHIRNNSVGMKNLNPAARAIVERSAESIQEVKIARMRRDMGLTGQIKPGIRYRHLTAGRWRDKAVCKARHKARLARIEYRKTSGYQSPTSGRDRAIAVEVLNGATCFEVGRRFALTSSRIYQIVRKIGKSPVS